MGPQQWIGSHANNPGLLRMGLFAFWRSSACGAAR
jgi:hypothetical protein